MTEWRAVLSSLPVVAVLLGGLTLGLVLLGRYWSLGGATLFLLVVPIGLAVAYLWWYATLPYEPRRAPSEPRPIPGPGLGAEEPFEDPVMEADRLDQAAHAGPPPEETMVVDDDPSSEAPPAP